MIWTVVVDNQDQLLDVQSSGCHRRGYHEATSAVLEVVDDAVSVVLIDTCVSTETLVSNLNECCVGSLKTSFHSNLFFLCTMYREKHQQHNM